MTATSPQQIEQRVRRFLESEVRCEFGGGQSRIGCLTPFEYPDGDGIVVRVRQRASVFAVSDQGETFARFGSHPPQYLKALEDLAHSICHAHGVEYKNRQVLAHCDLEQLGETVWEVSSAAAQVAQASEVFRPKARPRVEREFVGEIEHVFLERRLPVERERRIEGRSGHYYSVSIFLPEPEAILEPVGSGHWNKATSVYARFGDLGQTNGFRLYSVLDDREQLPDEVGARLLSQVSDVLRWSSRRDWLNVLVGR